MHRKLECLYWLALVFFVMVYGFKYTLSYPYLRILVETNGSGLDGIPLHNDTVGFLLSCSCASVSVEDLVRDPRNVSCPTSTVTDRTRTICMGNCSFGNICTEIRNTCVCRADSFSSAEVPIG